MRYHLTPVRMAIIKNPQTMLERVWREGNPPTLWECKLIQPLWRTVWRFLKKLKIELPHDPEISLLDRYPGKTMVQKDTCASVFTVALVTIATTQKAT